MEVYIKAGSSLFGDCKKKRKKSEIMAAFMDTQSSRIHVTQKYNLDILRINIDMRLSYSSLIRCGLLVVFKLSHFFH